MKTFTNHTPGARGINLKDGTTRWVEPGQSVEIDSATVANVPDLGKAAPVADADEAALVDAVQAENADLKKQVADQAKQIADLTALVEKANK